VLRVRPRSTRRAGPAVTTASGLAAATLNCAFLLQGLSGSSLPWEDSFISELESPGQPDSAFFRWASLLAGAATVLLAVGLYRRLPPGRLRLAGCWSLFAYGSFDLAAALMPISCTPSVDVACRRLDDHGDSGWIHDLHTAVSALAVIAVLASLGLLGLHLRRHPGWRPVGVLAVAGCVVLSLWSTVVSVMSVAYLPGLGLAQRVQITAVAAWLAVLALAPGRGRSPVSGTDHERIPSRWSVGSAP
jgi:hypothetical protein